MLLDSAHIQEQDAIFVSKVRAKKHQPPVEPLYTTPDAQKMRATTCRSRLRKYFFTGRGCERHVPRRRTHSWFRAGDFGHSGKRAKNSAGCSPATSGVAAMNCCATPIPVENVDYLQIESTYAARVHEDRPDADDLVNKYVSETLKQNGKIIIPAFSVGRTQQIVYVLHELTLRRKIAARPDLRGQPVERALRRRFTSNIPNVCARRFTTRCATTKTRSE